MEINPKYLKLISAVGMILGFIGTMVSGYAESKQNEIDIDRKVEEKFERYLAEKGEKTI